MRRTVPPVAAATLLALLSALGVLALSISGETSQGAQAAPGEGPNILVIMTDDQDAASLKFMPEVRSRLVSGGVKFTNAYPTDNLCCPARSTFLTGRYTHNTGIYQNDNGARPFRSRGLDEKTSAVWLSQSGYETGYFGKYLNGYESLYIPPGWDRWYAYNGAYAPVNDQGRQTRFDPDRIHEADKLGEVAGEWISEEISKPGPFFAVVAPHTPHAPSKVASRHRGEYSDLELPKPPNFNEANVSDKNSYVKGQGKLKPRQVKAMTRDYRQRMEALLSVDDMVDGLMDDLGSELSNTYIIYTSDNGWYWGQHRLKKKTFPYEGGAEVPLVVSGPGVERGAVVPHLVGMHDFAPTIAEMAGVSPSSYVDGKSFASLLSASRPAPNAFRKYLLMESRTRQARFDALLTRNETYAEFRQKGGGVFEEYYDLRRDPFQMKNRARSLSKKQLKRYHRRLEALDRCKARECRAAEGS